MGNVSMEIIGVEFVKALTDGALVAGMQPLCPQQQLLFSPGCAEGAHRVRIHALTRRRHAVDIPGQLGRIFATTRPRDGRINHNQTLRTGIATAQGAHADACPHGMSNKAVAR